MKKFSNNVLRILAKRDGLWVEAREKNNVIQEILDNTTTTSDKLDLIFFCISLVAGEIELYRKGILFSELEDMNNEPYEYSFSFEDYDSHKALLSEIKKLGDSSSPLKEKIALVNNIRFALISDLCKNEMEIKKYIKDFLSNSFKEKNIFDDNELIIYRCLDFIFIEIFLRDIELIIADNVLED
jgi:hypothetical protein